jgi:hypothetical protein
MEGEFWQPGTKGHMFLVKEISLIVDGLERRWEVVKRKSRRSGKVWKGRKERNRY